MLADPAIKEEKAASKPPPPEENQTGGKDELEAFQAFVRKIMIPVDVVALALVLIGLIILIVSLIQGNFQYRKDYCEMKDSLEASVKGCSPDYCCKDDGGMPVYVNGQLDLLDVTTHGQGLCCQAISTGFKSYCQWQCETPRVTSNLGVAFIALVVVGLVILLFAHGIMTMYFYLAKVKVDFLAVFLCRVELEAGDSA